MIQRAATKNVPLLVRTQNQQNSRRTLFIKTCCTLSYTPSCISSWILLHLVLSFLGFISAVIFLFVFDLMQSVPNGEKNENIYINLYKPNHVYLSICINKMISCEFVKKHTMTWKENSCTFHGTFCFHPLNKLGRHITWPNITFLESRST